MSAEKDSESVSCEAAPNIDYSDADEIHQFKNYERVKTVRQKVSELSPGDEVRVNNRARTLKVVPREDTDLLGMAYQETVFLKGNGTEYRIKTSEGSYPRMDRGDFTDDEYVAFLSVERDGDE